METGKKTAGGGTVYDDVFRTMLDKMPKLVIPLINEVFSEHYAEDEPVISLQNEHMELIDDKVIIDSYLRIKDKYYHLECQSNPDGTMAIRMLEYDFLIALKHAERDGYEYTLDYPNSCVLYLRCSEKTPDHLTVHVRFPDGKVCDYHTPIVKVNQYQFDEIFEKKLLFLLPYYIMRYEDALPAIEKDAARLSQLLEEYQTIYERLYKMRGRRQLSNYELTELRQLILKIVDWVAAKESSIRKGVKHMGGKVIEFEHDILMKQSEKVGEARGKALGEALGKASQLISSVDALIRNAQMPIEEACRLLSIHMSDYLAAKDLLSENK